MSHGNKSVDTRSAAPHLLDALHLLRRAHTHLLDALHLLRRETEEGHSRFLGGGHRANAKLVEKLRSSNKFLTEQTSTVSHAVKKTIAEKRN